MRHHPRIFDQRVATKRYGATFLRSLPTRRVQMLPRQAMFEALERFFSDAGRVDNSPSGES